jgi:hypothetical protein
LIALTSADAQPHPRFAGLRNLALGIGGNHAKKCDVEAAHVAPSLQT